MSQGVVQWSLWGIFRASLWFSMKPCASLGVSSGVTLVSWGVFVRLYENFGRLYASLCNHLFDFLYVPRGGKEACLKHLCASLWKLWASFRASLCVSMEPFPKGWLRGIYEAYFGIFVHLYENLSVTWGVF